MAWAPRPPPDPRSGAAWNPSGLPSRHFAGGQIDDLLDARGNVLRRKDSYVTIDWTYDGLDRVLTVSARNAADGNTVAYAYAYDAPGAEGRLASVSSAERTVRYGYDPAGRLASESVEEAGVAVPLVTTYSYDPDGALSGIAYPSGLALTYERDPATREVVRVVDGSGAVYADVTSRLPSGPVGSLTFGNGLSLSRSFDLRYEPLSVSSGPLSLAYVPSPAGDVASLTEAQTTRTFTHDFLGRLTESPGWLSYGLDGNGNRTAETVEGVTARYQYYIDRVTYRQLPGATAGSWVNELSFAIDQQGNVAGIQRFASNGWTITGGACFRHDALGRLVFAGVMRPGYASCPNDGSIQTTLARFQYDARNRRVARFTAATGEWTQFAHDPSGALLSETRRTADPLAPWAKVRDYVWLDGRPLAQIEYDGAAAHRYFFHLDAIGMPRALTSASGATVWSATPARPFGDLVETTTPDPATGKTVVTNLRLPGQYDERLLGGVGLQGPYYNWNRWYLPAVGRYMELDPIALEGQMNGGYAPDWYSYADGNPNSYIDPEGLYWAPPPPPIPAWPLVPAFGVGYGIGTGARYLFPGIDSGAQWLLDRLLGPPGGPPPPTPPPDCPPTSTKPCNCTCLGQVDPTVLPNDPEHGNRHVGKQPYPTACKEECSMRGFNNSQCT